MYNSSTLLSQIRYKKLEFDQLRRGKESLLVLLDQAELPEAVYNSNAIENSTLTISETERILLEQQVSRNVSVRELFEAKNLAIVSQYISNNLDTLMLDKQTVLLLHKMLLGSIDTQIAGRWRQTGEYVRIGTHLGAAPEQIEEMMSTLLHEYRNLFERNSIQRIADFHLEFEHIHPFIDGNGRIGRVLINLQLQQNNLPPIIIRDKEKQKYYKALSEYDHSQKKHRGIFTTMLSLAVLESFHKRIAYLRGQRIITLAQYATDIGEQLNNVLNKAKRQTIPAFRERGIWKIGMSE